MRRRTMLQKAQELAQATRVLEDISKKDDSVPAVPVEYKKGRPQIHEPMALCTGLIDKMPKGPRNETGSSPTRQKQILQQAIRKVERRSGGTKDELDPTQ